jgi:hypothetical protein
MKIMAATLNTGMTDYLRQLVEADLESPSSLELTDGRDSL